MAKEPGDETREERVWDPAIRVFHWALVVTVCVGWFLGDNLTFENIDWHFYLGYATGGLVVARLIWGVVGPPPARLTALAPSPRTLRAYLAVVARREPSHWPGHNPLGGLSVLALLATLTVQVTSGLFSESDDFFTEGPLAGFVSSAVRGRMAEIHDVSSSVLLALVGLHVAAVLFYLLWKRENLIRPMITGRKRIRRR